MNIAKGHVDTALVYWLIALTTSFSYLRDPALVPRGVRANCVQTIKSFNWVITLAARKVIILWSMIQKQFYKQEKPIQSHRKLLASLKKKNRKMHCYKIWDSLTRIFEPIFWLTVWNKHSIAWSISVLLTFMTFQVFSCWPEATFSPLAELFESRKALATELISFSVFVFSAQSNKLRYLKYIITKN